LESNALHNVCRSLKIKSRRAHCALSDALAAADIFLYYLNVCREKNKNTFKDIKKGSYKFLDSWNSAPVEKTNHKHLKPATNIRCRFTDD